MTLQFPPSFPEAAPTHLADEQLRGNLFRATTTIRAKRAAVVGEVEDWEELRNAARAIKEDALENLASYLTQLEASVKAAGGVVHWARDHIEANRIIQRLVEEAGAEEVVKVKSITTEEIGLNQALETHGIRAIETDLAELIIQLSGDSSSHFLVPAIHKNRTQIRDVFREEMGLPELTDHPGELAEAARIHLREKFLSAGVAISGANFAVAETGTVGVVESEGNGRMCLTLPKFLITVMGIEKVLPTVQDLEVFLQLLPRSATGERMNPYTTLWTGVTPGDGPRAFHLVLLDNGRTQVLSDPVGRQALHCIRCSACLNSCPVYARVGGHAYHSVYSGPIGSILTPLTLGPGVHDSLAFASTLCGACADVCPVKIDIPKVLLHLRGKAVVHKGAGKEKGMFNPGRQERVGLAFLAWLFKTPRRYRWGLRWARRLQRFYVSRGWIHHLPGVLEQWTRGRDMRALPHSSFRDWWRKERG